MKDQIVENVIDKYYERSQTGITKYGTTLESNNRDNYLKHLQEELMDATLYIEKFLSLEREITILVKAHGNDADLGKEVRKLIR
jgi:hypothetical protein